MITAHAPKIPPTVTEINSSFSAVEMVLSDPLTESNNTLIYVLLNASHKTLALKRCQSNSFTR